MVGLYSGVARFLQELNVDFTYVPSNDEYEAHLRVECVRVFHPRTSDVRCWEVQAGKRYEALTDCHTPHDVALAVAALVQ